MKAALQVPARSLSHSVPPPCPQTELPVCLLSTVRAGAQMSPPSGPVPGSVPCPRIRRGGGGGGEQGPRSVLVRGGGRLEGEAPASFSGVWNDPPLGRDGPAKALLRDCSGQDEGRQWGEQLTLKE